MVGQMTYWETKPAPLGLHAFHLELYISPQALFLFLPICLSLSLYLSVSS